MDNKALKAKLIKELGQARVSGTRAEEKQIIDVLRALGEKPSFSTEDSASRGKKLLEDFRGPEKRSTIVPGKKEVISDVIKVPAKGGLEERDAKLAAHRAARAAKKATQVPGGEKGLKKAVTKALSKLGKKGLKAIPLIGPAAAALTTGDASAAIPLLGEADATGPAKGSPESVIEDASATAEQRRAAIEAIRNRKRNREE